MPGSGVAEQPAPDPRVGREQEVAQGLDERPLVVDALVEEGRVERPGAVDGLTPASFDDLPRRPVARGVGGSHRDPLGVAPVELGHDERGDVDAVDGHVLDLARDLDVDQLDASHHDLPEVGLLEPGAGQVDEAEARAGEVLALEDAVGPGEAVRVDHVDRLERVADHRLPQS